MNRLASPRTRFALGLALVALLKLWLVADTPIAARAIPHDQQRYAEMADQVIRGHWLGDYDAMTLIREPSYPVFIAVVHAVGVPLRLAVELLLIGASGLLACVLVRLGLPRSVAFCCFAVLVLQPHSLLVDRELLPSGFYLPVLLMAIALLLLAGNAVRARNRWLHAGGAGLLLGILWTTRPEKPLVLGLVLVFAGLDALARRARGSGWRASLAAAAGVIGIAFASIASVACGFAAMNALHYGVFRTSDLSGGGFAAANRALLSIEHASPRRFVLVPRDVRERVYAVSPAFRELRPHLEQVGWGRNVSCNLVQVCDDYAGAWFMWTLREAAGRAGHMGSAGEAAGRAGHMGSAREAAGRAGHMGSAREADAWFQRVADDIENARVRGELPPARSTLGFLHPYPDTYLPHLGTSLARLARRFAMPGDAPDWDPARDPSSTPAAIRQLFDRVARRDPVRVRSEPVVVEGWAVAAVEPIVRVSLRRARVRGARGAEAPDEPVVMAARDVTTGAREKLRFRFEVEKTTGAWTSLAPSLWFEGESGAVIAVPVPGEGEIAEHEGVLVRIDTLREPDASHPARRGLGKLLWRGHSLAIVVAAGVGVVALLLLALPPWRRRLADPLLVAAALMGFAVASRVGMLMLIDASSFPAWSSRYIYPAVSLFTCTVLVVTTLALRHLRSRGPGHDRLESQS